MKTTHGRPKPRIGFLGFDGVVALDLVGPMDVFAFAGEAAAPPGEKSAYELLVVSAKGRPFTCESGLVMQAHCALAEAEPLDTLIIPGGCGLREAALMKVVAPWLKAGATRVRRIASICTGIYAMAEAGLLDGRRVATHWRFAADVARRYPKVKVDPEPLFIKDGSFYSSAGVTAGIDLSLALIEEDLGPGVALAAARDMVVYIKREGTQAQFSAPLKFQTDASGRFADLAAWIVRHLEADLSVERLAERACVSPRHFARLFKQAMGRTPASYIEDLRLDEARQRLASGNAKIEAIATSIGYGSADAFRRAFERRFQLSPATYRQRFGRRAKPFALAS
ncbi:MAG: GlxA family transcriptional regulator [Verrucomicrobia bacterium]|nr:GlxA family transcriptional regulator [Verrucomicrobiota bacterium]